MEKKKEEADKYISLQERLRAIKGLKTYGSINPAELCLVSGVTIPKKFKRLEFKKYNGTMNPKTYIITYYQEMTEVVHDEKLIVHFFHKSLIGAALKWYMQLDSFMIKTWKDLVDAFIRKYCYNLDITITRNDLYNMEKKSTESFKEYTQRWRDQAA